MKSILLTILYIFPQSRALVYIPYKLGCAYVVLSFVAKPLLPPLSAEIAGMLHHT